MNTKSLILTLVILGLPIGFVFTATKAVQAEVSSDTKSVKAVQVGNKFCPVTGDKIPAPGEKGTMGDEPVKYEHNGKIYNLCCKMCVRDFKKNPEKYSKIAEDEVAKEKMMEQKEDSKGATK